MKFVKIAFNNVFDIESIVSMYYFEFAKDYIFHGEKHDFWEFVYVDKGEIEVMADTKGYKITQGQIIFHKPNEFHNLWANGKTAPNVVVISFVCNSAEMDFFQNKIINLNDKQKEILNNILREGKNVFYMEHTTGDHDVLCLKENIEFGSEQLIKIYLEQFLIYLRRQNTQNQVKPKQLLSVKKRSDNDTVIKITGFLECNIYNNICLKDIAEYVYLSESYIQTLFKKYQNISIMKYYRNLKIDEAKRLIRQSSYNFTQIAERLCYNSVHHFSKQFKEVTGMTPSQYSRSMMIN